MSRNDKIDVALKNYFGDPQGVTWKIANDVELGLADANPTLDNLGAGSGMSRRVGFSRNGRLGDYDQTTVPASFFGYEEKANSSYLYATSSGLNTSVYAKWYIDFS